MILHGKTVTYVTSTGDNGSIERAEIVTHTRRIGGLVASIKCRPLDKNATPRSTRRWWIDRWQWTHLPGITGVTHRRQLVEP